MTIFNRQIAAFFDYLKTLGIIASYSNAGENSLAAFYYASRNNTTHSGNDESKGRNFLNGTPQYNVFSSTYVYTEHKDFLVTSGKAPTTLWYPITNSYKNKDGGSDVVNLVYAHSMGSVNDSNYGPIVSTVIVPYVVADGAVSPFIPNPNSLPNGIASTFSGFIASYSGYYLANPRLMVTPYAKSYYHLNYDSNTPETNFTYIGFKNIYTGNVFYLWDSRKSNYVDINNLVNEAVAGWLKYGGYWHGKLRAMDLMTRVDDIIPVNDGAGIAQSISGYSYPYYYLYLNNYAYEGGANPANQSTYLQFNAKGFKKNNLNGSSFARSMKTRDEPPFGMSLVYTYIRIMNLERQRVNPHNPAEATEAAAYAEYRFYPLGSKHTGAVHQYSPKINGQHSTQQSDKNWADKIEISYDARGVKQNITIYVHYEVRQCTANYSPDDTVYLRMEDTWDSIMAVNINDLFLNYNGTGLDPDGSESNGKVYVSSNYWPKK
jgi:hypothetical protein